MTDLAPVTVSRYPLAAGRELLIMVAAGRAFLTVHGRDGACMTGPLAIHLVDVEAVTRALTQATGAELAADMERARQVLRAAPGVAGYKRLRRDMVGISMERRRAAVEALRAAGEVVDRGERGRPRLYIAPKAGYSHRNQPDPVGVDLLPVLDNDARRAPFIGEADLITSPEGTR